MYILELYVTNANFAVDRCFTYLSKEAVEIYTRVFCRFHNVRNVGLVVSCTYSDESIEDITKRLGFTPLWIDSIIDKEPLLNDQQFSMANWLAHSTISPFMACLNTMLPKTFKTSKEIKAPKSHKIIHVREVDTEGLSKRQKEVYALLKDGDTLSSARQISSSIVNRFIQIGIVEVEEEYVSYPSEQKCIHEERFLPLTSDQQKAYDAFYNSDKDVFYLFGVTGAGKTEVYLHLCRDTLKRGKQVLILVPEISLTPQMISRVKERFDGVAFYHSELSDQQRYEQYMRVKNREADIVVGTRSSIFLPFSSLGLIIVDEENDGSYIQDNVPCYDAKKVALYRAYHEKAKVLMASATPSLDMYSRALRGDYELLKLPKRVNDCLPTIELIDLNAEIRKKGGSYIISEQLRNQIVSTLSHHKQVLILLNRRGYAPIVKCEDCGSTLTCSDCDLALSYHKDENVLKCHQCGKTYKLVQTCPKCGKNHLIYYGFGTKRAEEELKKMFPDANVERMDRDSTTRKGSHEAILNRLEKGEIDILIGTQMIAKGLDYPDVTLVGILNADAGLMHQDFNAAKTTFDLLMQASGRSGRSADKGKVLVQVFNPEHYVLKALLKQDYMLFYQTEMNIRFKSGYPPYRRFLELIVSDRQHDRLCRSVEILNQQFLELPFKHYQPMELNRLSAEYRMRILFVDRDLSVMVKALDPLIRNYSLTPNHSKCKVVIDPLYLE